MDFELAAIPVAALVGTAVALTLRPVWMRPGMYFGVRVPPEYSASPEAQRSRGSYSLKVWLATAIGIAFALAAAASAQSQFWLGSLGFAIQLGAAAVAFHDGWRDTKRHGIEASPVRTADQFARRPRVPGGATAVVTPFLVVAAVGAYLISHWAVIPERFPVHWDMQGHANGWSNRTVAGVFGPLFIAFVVLAVLAAVIAAQTYAARQAPAGSRLERRTRTILVVPVLVMWIIAVMFSLAALTPVILVDGRFPIPPVVLILIPVGAVIAGIWLAARASAEPGEVQDDTPNECWKWGQFYYNPDDSSIMVERRFGIGYTFNFARWQSWLMMGAILALPIVLVVLARH